MMTHFGAGMARRPRLSLPSLVALAALVALALAPQATLAHVAPAPTPVSGTTVLIRGGLGNQTDPHISGTLVSYTNVESTSSEIRYHDLASGVDAAIPNDGHRDSLSDVSGTTIVFRRVYTDGSTTKRPILAFDTANPTAEPVELDPIDGIRRAFASIGGRTVAWMEFVGASSMQTDIVAHDLDTGLSARLTTDGAGTADADGMSNGYPAVSADGSTIVWTKCATTGTNCDVYVVRKAADGTWGVAVQLSDSAGEEILPDSNGEIVVYTSNAGGNFDIWWENVDGTNEHLLPMPGIQSNPNINGSLITFESEAVGSTNADLFSYDLATGILYQVTNTPDVDETLNDVSVGPAGAVRVVWANPDGVTPGQNDVHALTFQLDAAAYDICPLFDQSRSYRLRSTVPIQLQLCDAQGQNLSSPSLVVTATELVKRDSTASAGTVEDAGNANPDSNFRYDETAEAYVFNLSTRNLSIGTWELRFTVTGDSTVYSVTFDLR